MMFDSKILCHRTRQTIHWRGQEYTFHRPTVNDYGEKDSSVTTTIEANGLFYKATSQYLQRVSQDSATLTSKEEPMILMLWEQGSQIQSQDFVVISETKYIVNRIRNLNDMNLVAQVILEEVL